MHLGTSTYTIASYRIAGSNVGSSSRGAGRAARGAESVQSRRGGRWGSSGVPRPSSELFRERQAPDHFFPWFIIILWTLYFNCCIMFRSCLQPLLHYTLFTLFYPILLTLLTAIKYLLSLLRPVEVRWFPVTCEL
jgi:hypothetical protein